MVCPFCGSIKTAVRNSRHTNRRGQVWRRRQCERCGRLFTTRESVEVGFLEVIKRNNQREQYSRAKLLRSLILATDHLNGSADSAYALADTIEVNLLSNLRRQTDNKELLIHSEDIAAEAADVLKRFDFRSYIKYISYQTNHLDARDLKRSLKR